MAQFSMKITPRSGSLLGGNQQLVYPQDADIELNRISILTPIGTALIGLGIGQSIEWRTNDGRNRTLTILAVDQPLQNS